MAPAVRCPLLCGVPVSGQSVQGPEVMAAEGVLPERGGPQGRRSGGSGVLLALRDRRAGGLVALASVL